MITHKYKEKDEELSLGKHRDQGNLEVILKILNNRYRMDTDQMELKTV